MKKAKIIQKVLEVPIPNPETFEVRYRVPITVPIRVEEDGTEVMTEEAEALLNKVQFRHMGLLLPEEIKELRTKRLNKTQSEMAELLGCGEKSYTRWENGHSRPTQMVNTLLRLLWEGRSTVQDLEAVRGRRLEPELDVPVSQNVSVLITWDEVLSQACEPWVRHKPAMQSMVTIPVAASLTDEHHLRCAQAWRKRDHNYA